MVIQYDDFLTRLDRIKEYESYMSALCVFHDDSSPSMLVFKDGWFRCLSCERQGNWKTLWNKLQGQPVIVRSDVKIGWEGPGVRPEEAEDVCWQAHLDLVNFSSLGWYLEMRGIDSMIDMCELGYWNGWYTIPVRDVNGRFLTAVYRSSPPIQNVNGVRYWSKGTPVMYVPDWRLLEKNRRGNIFVVYGMFDAIALASVRLPVVTVSSGKDSFQADWLEGYGNQVYIVPDKGEYTTAMRHAKELGWRGNVINLDYPEGYEDPADFAKNGKMEDLYKILMSETGWT